METKMITEKQITFIQSLKHFIDDKKRGNPLDRLDMHKFTRYDASKLIQGLLGLKEQHSHLIKGKDLSFNLDEALELVFGTLEHYAI